jgi:hypothetical protein
MLGANCKNFAEASGAATRSTRRELPPWTSCPQGCSSPKCDEAYAEFLNWLSSLSFVTIEQFTTTPKTNTESTLTKNLLFFQISHMRKSFRYSRFQRDFKLILYFR